MRDRPLLLQDEPQDDRRPSLAEWAELTAKQCFKHESRIQAGWYASGAVKPSGTERWLSRLLGEAGKQLLQIKRLAEELAEELVEK